MLLILIPIAWLALVVLVLAACTMASRADTNLLAAAAETAAVMADSSSMSSAARAITDGGRDRAHQRRRPGPSGQAPVRGRRPVEPGRRTVGDDGSVRTGRGSRTGLGAR